MTDDKPVRTYDATLRYITEHPGLTFSEVASALGIQKVTANNHIYAMARDGVAHIVRTKAGGQRPVVTVYPGPAGAGDPRCVTASEPAPSVSMTVSVSNDATRRPTYIIPEGTSRETLSDILMIGALVTPCIVQCGSSSITIDSRQSSVLVAAALRFP